jgi:AcrR family transcriptional regulator
LSPLFVARFGTKIVVTAGLVLVAVGMWLFSHASVDSGYPLVALVLVVIGVGMAIAMAPATDSIMGSLPPEKAGIGSAVNDTTREIGGALGVAILGSITASSYTAAITASPVYAAAAQQSPQGAAALKDSVGSAALVAAQLPADMAKVVTATANAAFVHALDHTVVVGAIVALLGAAVAAIFLPARPAPADAGLADVDQLVITAAKRLPPDSRVPRDVTGTVLQLLTEAGFSSLTFHGVASRSGVSTKTLERYWGSRVDMVVDAVKTAFAEISLPDTGSFRADCEVYIERVGAAFANPRAVPLISQLISEGARDEELAAQLRTRLVGPRRTALLDMIDRAVAEGQLAPDTDPGTLADTLVAPLYYRALVTGEPISADTARQIVAIVLDHKVVDRQN